jgi:spoIIIJ-associated protein
VKDPLFSGKDIAEALEVAARALAVPAASLKYVVLDPGRPGGLGVSPSKASIAVLLEGSVPPGLAVEADKPVGADDDDEDLTARIRRVVGAVIEAAGLETSFTLEESDEALRVVLEGPGREFFLDDAAEVFEALEHLLQRMFNHEVSPRRLRLDCEGYRDARDSALREQALEIAASVRADGQPRVMPPLNAYERRIVHMALAEVEGIATYSVGEGANRRVTVAPAGLTQG